MAGRSNHSRGRKLGHGQWPEIFIDDKIFFPPDQMKLVDLRQDQGEDGDKYLDIAAQFYMENFNKAGEKAGVGSPWTHAHVLAQLKKRLKVPGVAFVLVSSRDNSKCIAGFFTELMPSLHGWQAIELDVIVDESERKKGLGAKVTLYGYNQLMKQCYHNFKQHVRAFTGETYCDGYQKQLWSKIGFERSLTHSGGIDFSSANENTCSSVACGRVEAKILDLSNIDSLVSFLSQPNLQASTKPWEQVDVVSYAAAMGKYIAAMQGKAPVLAYLAVNQSGKTVGYLSANSTIRRGGQIVLSSPECVVDEEATGGEVHSGAIVRFLLRQAAKEALDDARKEGLREARHDFAGVDFGTQCEPAFFTARSALPEFASLDAHFYGIAATADRESGVRGSIGKLQDELVMRCSRSGGGVFRPKDQKPREICLVQETNVGRMTYVPVSGASHLST